MRTLYDLVGSSGAEPQVPFVAYHGVVNTDADGPVEVCVPFIGEVKPSGEARVRAEPAHKEAFTRITKGQVAFPGILDAYQAAEKWVTDHKLDLSGSPREVYFADWSVIGPDDPGCDIAFPIKG
jgi:effector-binding domain-containing protein